MEGGDLRMSSIDERVVQMKFDNAAFEQGIARTRDSLGRFTKQLELKGASKGLENVDAAAKKLSLQNIETGVQAVADKFKAMSVVGITALASLTQRAVSAGLNIAKSFTFSPVMDGFHEYETNLNSIQTILANTQASGATLKDVNKSLNDLNHYSDQTIYNFSEMAKNIGTFTAAGVGLKESTSAIKGIANLAALSGSNSEQASGAMYQLSQAISAGRVSLEDWNSVVNAGMGGTVFQRALAQTAEKMGTLKDGAVKLSGKMKNVTIDGKSFRESITAKPGQESWLTSKVLTNTLAQFTGDLTDAQLKAEGFSKSQIKAIQAQAKTAKEAATQVKTFSQLMDTTKEAIGSGWTQTFQTIFGDFTEAKGLFTGISNSIGKIVNNSSNARNKMLSDWKKLGGRDALIKGLENTFQALGSVIKPIKDAFRQIFPATTGKQLADMTKNFRDFTAKLKIGSETADKLKRTFAGVFAIFGIAVDIIKGVVGTIFDLVGVATKGSGGFLNFTAKIGDFLVALRNGIKEGNGLTNFFKGLGTVLAIPIKLIQKLAGFLGSLFKDTDSKGVEKSVEGVSKKLEPLGHLGNIVSKAWEKTLTVMHNVGDFFSKLGDNISRVLKSIGIDLGSMFEGFDSKTLFAGLDTGLLAGLYLIIKKFLGSFGDGAGGIFDAISEGIENMTGTFTTMQSTLKAATLLQIALAIGVLAVSLSILAKINPKDLSKAAAGITVLFGQLLGSLAIFQKFIGSAGFAKLPFVMGSLILLAAAVLILVQAVKQLSGLSWNELAKGMTGLAVTMGLVVGALKLMPNPKGMISTGLGLILLAAAIKILASAVKDMSGLGWNEIAKGLVGVGAILGALTLFTMFAKADAGGLAQGAGILLLAVGIKILASAVKDMSKMSWNEIAKGLVTLAGALGLITGALMLIPPTAPAAALGVLGVAISLGMVGKALEEMAKMSWAEIGSSLTVMLGAMAIIAAALYVIPPTAPLAAAGVLLVAISLKQIAEVLTEFAAFSWEDIGKAMLMLAGTMGIIAGAMLLMTGALPGAAATIIIAGALAILAPVLMQFSQMSLAEIGTSLLMLAGVFAVFGVAALLLAPVVPVMIGLGIAVGILGAGMLLAGAGVFLFATGLTALAAAGAAGAAAIVGIVGALIGLIPKFMEGIGKGVIAFAKVIATAGPAIFQAMTVVIGSMIKAIAKLTPQIVTMLLRMLTMLLQQLSNYVPKMVVAGMNLITGVLNGIAANIGKMVTAATNVIVNFLNGISKNLPRIIDAGVKLIISFVNGVANAIRNNTAAMNAAGKNLASAIIEGMVSGLASGIGSIVSAAKHIAGSAIDAAKGVLHINSPSKVFIAIGKSVNEGFLKGLQSGDKDKIDAVFKDLVAKIKSAMADSGKDVETLQAKLKRLTSARHKDNAAIAATRKALAQAQKEHAAESAAYTEVTKKLTGQHKALDDLAKKYQNVSDKLKDAKDKLADIVKTRDDFKKQIIDQYDNLPDITPETHVAGYEADLKTQIEKTKEFSNTLQRLRDLGLNDDAYKQLLAKGIDALPFANELLAGGKDAVSQVNDLDKQLATASKALGIQASSELYDAAVHAAEGLVKGLQAQQKAIEAIMDSIANAMVKAIKKKLGIKSPSRVFMEIGSYSAKGLARGMDEMSGVVEKSASSMGVAATESLRKSLSNAADMVSGGIEVKPVITPVLDLSSVKKDAGLIGTLLPSQAISVDSAYSKARYVASSYASNQAADAQTSSQTQVAPVIYNQYNNSPKALSSAQIYRQTKNQLSRTKGGLSTS
jgi:tape measure domain-containing protein